MTDVLIRNVPDEDLRRVDEKAARQGLSRNDYLKRAIAQEASRGEPTGRLTLDDLRSHAEATADLLDEDVMRQAWA